MQLSIKSRAATPQLGHIESTLVDVGRGARTRPALLHRSAKGGVRRPRPTQGGPRGFTLIELLTVMAIVGILSAIVIGVGRRANDTGRIARAKAELAAISAALEGYRRQYGDYPQTADEAALLQSLLGKLGPTGAAITGRVRLDLALLTTQGAADPITDATAVLTDPWAQPYIYVYKVPANGWTNPAFVLYSVGPDGQDDAALLTGGSPNPAATGNADNIYANQ